VGERETHPYVIPEIISQLVRSPNHTVQLGNNTTRDFMYAGDAVRYAAELMECGLFGEVYNLGSERSLTIYELAQVVQEYMEPGQKVNVAFDSKRSRKLDLWHLRSNNAKIHQAVSYRSETTLEKAICKTFQWYTINGRRWPWERT
jgi:nucleoside-diphosphate-sugar epimerase